MPKQSTLLKIAAKSAMLFLLLMSLGLSSAALLHALRGSLLDQPAAPKKPPGPSSEVNALQSVAQSQMAEDARNGEIVGASSEKLPASVLIDVPFSPQSPFGDWDQPYKDACEETSVLMAVAWARGETLTPEAARREILNQVAFEEYNFGYHRNTSIAETLKLLGAYYGHKNSTLAYDITVDDIKRELARGYLVIVPLSGEILANPYFRQTPAYHMLVIRGYDDEKEQFITNDPGTIYGRGYGYGYNHLYQAIHDWEGYERDVKLGRKGMIIVRPEGKTFSQAEEL